MITIYSIWDFSIANWVHEDHGTNAGILAFSSQIIAERRAAEHFGFDLYSSAFAAGVCEVRPLEVNKPVTPFNFGDKPAWASRLELLVTS